MSSKKPVGRPRKVADPKAIGEKIMELDSYLYPVREWTLTRRSQDDGAVFDLDLERIDHSGSWEYSGDDLEKVLDQALAYERHPEDR